MYLSDSRFDEAYSLVVNLIGYRGTEESKLVAKAYLLVALRSTLDKCMGSNLRDIYSKVDQGD